MEQIRILHLEDNRNDSDLVQHLLIEEGLKVAIERVQSRNEFTHALADRAWDLVLADYALPAFDGYGALAIARQLAPDLPFVFVTGKLGEDVVVETLKRGATDYVLKQRMERLVPAVRRALHESAEKRLLKETKDRLQESEERFRLLIDGIRDYAIYLIGCDGKVASWNKGAARIFGFSEVEAIGLPFSSFFQQADQQERRCERLLREAERAERIQEELWQVRKDGEAFWADVIIGPLVTGRRLRGYAVITQDITERRRAKAQLEEDRQERARLQERFLSHISHELRSPLATIVDFTSIIGEGLAGVVTEEQRSYLDLVLQAANSLGVMVNSLLDLTRSDWHKLPLSPSCVALESLLADSCESARAAARQKNITVEYRKSPAGLPLVHADRPRVQEVLTNLLDNAIKYSPSGGWIGISAEVCSEDPEFIRITVADDGPGIPSEQAAHVFDRFYRVKEASGDHPGGLGLGLYISREIINAHGGELWLDASVTRGSTFRFTLPKFSLERELMPIISPKNLARGKLALITVTLPEVPSSSAVDFGRYLKSVGDALKKLIYATDDLVLPHIGVAGFEDKLHIVAFAGEHGLAVMEERIRERLSQSLELRPLKGDFEVKGRLMEISGLSATEPEAAAHRIAGALQGEIGLITPTGAEDAGLKAESAGSGR